MKKLLLLGLTAMLMACGTTNPPPEETAIAPQLMPETRVLDAETRDALTKLTVANPGCFKMVAARPACQVVLEYGTQTATLKNLTVGNILAAGASSVAPNGYLLKVTGISTTGGKTLINATEASLYEALTQGEVSKQLKLMPSDVRSVKALNGAVHFRNTSPKAIDFGFAIGGVIYDQDGNSSTTDDQLVASGSFDFNAQAGVDAGLTWKKVYGIPVYPNGVYFEAGLGFSQNASIGFKAGSSSLNLVNQEIELAAYNFNPITVFIGPVPVVLVPRIVVKAYANGSIGASASFGASENLSAQLGVFYRKGFGVKKDFNKSFTATTSTGSGAFKLRAGLSVSGELLLYGLVGPQITGRAYLEFDAALKRQPLWQVAAGVSASVGLHVGLGIPDYDVELFDENIGEIARAANSAPAVSFNKSYPSSPLDVATTFDLCATANDPEGDTTSLAFKIDGAVYAGVCGTYKFSSVGPHTVSATATDTAGASKSVSLSLNLKEIPPTITITTPTAGSSFVEGTTVAFAVTGSFSSVGTGVFIGDFCTLVTWEVTSKPTGGSASFSNSLNTGCTPSIQFFGAGSYTVKATAKDPAGRTVNTSTNVTITASQVPIQPAWEFGLLNANDNTVYAPNGLAPAGASVIAKYLLINKATPQIASWKWSYKSSRDNLWHDITPDTAWEDTSSSIVQFTFPDCRQGNIYLACDTTLSVTGYKFQGGQLSASTTYSAVYSQIAAPK
jgi:hypothetical protein